jgi:hypothetical protein
MKLFAIIIIFSTLLSAQGMFEPVNSDLYSFLETLSIKGIITFDYEIKPWTRIEIAKKLILADTHTQQMTDVEKELLNFYYKDFKHEINLIEKDFKPDIKPEFIVLDKDRRIRFFEYGGNEFSFFADPMLSLSLQSIAGEKLTVLRNGFSFYGYALDNWAYNLRFFDNTEIGKNLDLTKELTPERRPSVTKISENSFEYDVVNASIGYYWKDGSISLGKEYFQIGSGMNGNIILGDQAPSFPFIRLDYKPVDWLRFFYFHGFLISNVPDSSTYRYSEVPGRNSISEVPKFIAFHTLSFYPISSLSFTIGESIVYSETLQPIYLIPVMFFRVADHYLATHKSSSTGNAQMFADASFSNASLQSKLYGTLFIDELSIENLFKGGNLSAIAYTLGVETSDILIKNSTFNIEYSRVNPFVYMNSVEAQSYANDSYTLGDWIGSNGDILSVKYGQYLNSATKFTLSTWYFRKGKKELPVEQYISPYPEFLYGERRDEYGVEFRLKFRPWHPVTAEAYYSYVHIKDDLLGRTLDYKLSGNHYFGIHFSYGF